MEKQTKLWPTNSQKKQNQSLKIWKENKLHPQSEKQLNNKHIPIFVHQIGEIYRPNHIIHKDGEERALSFPVVHISWNSL